MPDSELTIACLALGPLQTNAYVVARAGAAACWVFDPGPQPGPLLDHLEAHGRDVRRILLTHGHGDHLGGVAQVKQAFPRAILTAPASDAFMLTDASANLSAGFNMPVTAPTAEQLISPGDRMDLEGIEWVVLDTAGHTPGGVSFHCPAAQVVIVGDTLFAGSIGRFDLPGSDGRRLVDNIRRHLMTLPDGTRVLPGHGQATTIGAERRGNPYLQQRT